MHHLVHLFEILVVGLFAGAIAQALTPNPRHPRGCITTMLLGLAGAFVGSYLGRILHIRGHGIGVIGAIFGAIGILVACRIINTRRL